ncbi:MAG TPA: hypothetical protein VIY27_08305 [Myxococcota bacterium]
MSPEEANLIAKAQIVRLGDVFVIGPLMLYGATRMAAQTPGQKIARFLLASAGIATVIFNGRNYLMVESLRGS